MYNNFMNKKLVIFDLDGTLLNTLQDLCDSTNYALERFGYPKRSIDEIRNFVGNGVKKLIERSVPIGADYSQCLEVFKNYYSLHMFDKTTPYNDIIEILSQLKTLKIKTAVVSNKYDLAVKELCKKYFSDLIDFAVGENEKKGIRKKPAPDSILSILKKFDIASQEAVYVGDSEVDIQTAINSNIECVSVTWGFKDKDFLSANGAKIIIDKPKELIKYL